jgi:putative tricarboxylic transport membrane protein
LPYLGFLIMTTVYLFFQMSIMCAREKRKPVMFVVISAIASVVVYFTFVKVFSLMLPAGILG